MHERNKTIMCKKAVNYRSYSDFQTELWKELESGASPTGGGGSRESGPPHFWKPRGSTSQKFRHFSIFFLKMYNFFAFSNIFKTKWPKSEEKLNFGGRWVWVPTTPTPQSKTRGDAPGSNSVILGERPLQGERSHFGGQLCAQGKPYRKNGIRICGYFDLLWWLLCYGHFE